MSASLREDLPPIEVGWSSQRLSLFSIEEDWTGITNPIERRKLQNRLNQRARRTRTRKKDPKLVTSGESTPKVLDYKSDPEEASSKTSSSSQSSPVESAKPVKPGCMAANPHVQVLMHRFAEHAYASYMQCTPVLSHLSLLVKYNVSSALKRNADILGVTAEYVLWDGVSPFVKQGSTLGLKSPQRENDWPVSLHPTQLQCSIAHHPWVDVFPWPRLRDNMLLAFEHPYICDEDDMCRDVCDYDEPGSESILVVWGDAWDPHSWEITPGFLKKWGWLLSGCEDFLQATNYWRAKREERPLSRREIYEAIQLSIPERLRAMAI